MKYSKSKTILRRYDIYRKTNIDIWGDLILRKTTSFKTTERLIETLYKKLVRRTRLYRYPKWKNFNKNLYLALRLKKLISSYFFSNKYNRRNIRKNKWKAIKGSFHYHPPRKKQFTKFNYFGRNIYHKNSYKYANIMNRLVKLRQKLNLNFEENIKRKEKFNEISFKRSRIFIQAKIYAKKSFVRFITTLISLPQFFYKVGIIKSAVLFCHLRTKYRNRRYLTKLKRKRFVFTVREKSIFKKRRYIRWSKQYRYDRQKKNVLGFYSAKNNNLALSIGLIFEFFELNITNILLRLNWIGSYYLSKLLIRSGALIINGNIIYDPNYILNVGDNLIASKYFKAFIYRMFSVMLSRTFFFSPTIYKKYNYKWHVSRYFWKRKNYLKRHAYRVSTLGYPKYMEVNHKLLAVLLIKNPNEKTLSFFR